MDTKVTRRSFLQILTGSVFIAPALLSMKNLFAVDMKTLPAGAKALDEKAPMANALGYKHDAKDVDKMKFKKYADGNNCSNCSQYIVKNDYWGECRIIKGGLVNKAGWCNSYVAKPKAAT